METGLDRSTRARHRRVGRHRRGVRPAVRRRGRTRSSCTTTPGPRAGRGCGGAAVVQADLTDEAAVDRLFAEAGELDVCAAVAGVWPEEDVPVWELHARALARDGRREPDRDVPDRPRLPRAASATARARSSSSARPPASSARPGHADYAAAKSGILGGLLLSLKNEVVRRNARAPGERRRAGLDGLADDRAAHSTRPRSPRSPARWRCAKVATPEDVAAQVVALSSPLISGHVTGQVVTVAGGMEGRVIHG